jgi:hypothetical protein
MLNDANAIAHPAYNDAVNNAVRRACEDHGACFTVYFDGASIFVRASEAAPPPNSKVVCIAQWWSGNTAQLRFDGARSEWVRS